MSPLRRLPALATLLLILAAPTALAVPEPARGLVMDATYGCLAPQVAEVERRESQVEALAQGTLPYPMPTRPNGEPTASAIVEDARPTLVAAHVDGVATCLAEKTPDLGVPDVVGLAWGIACPHLPGCR